jgi:hypothetical protein
MCSFGVRPGAGRHPRSSNFRSTRRRSSSRSARRRHSSTWRWFRSTSTSTHVAGPFPATPTPFLPCHASTSDRRQQNQERRENTERRAARPSACFRSHLRELLERLQCRSTPLSPLNLGSAGNRFIRLILGEVTLSLLFFITLHQFFFLSIISALIIFCIGL